ncbi:hypothetical protein PHISP_07577 [Aspergillus sp. HF37]|nr:hypothetical protein PHISP_07577 [Aspergillus sp. HF37]
MSLADLPNELVFIVAETLDDEGSESDVNGLSQMDRRLYKLLNPLLYQRSGGLGGRGTEE